MSQGKEMTTSLSLGVSHPPPGRKEELAGGGRFWSVSRSRTLSPPVFPGNCVERMVVAGLQEAEVRQTDTRHSAASTAALDSSAGRLCKRQPPAKLPRRRLPDSAVSSVPSTQPLPASRSSDPFSSQSLSSRFPFSTPAPFPTVAVSREWLFKFRSIETKFKTSVLQLH